MDVATGAILGTLATLLVREGFSYRRETRQRDWEMTDRKDRVALRAHVAKVIDTNAELTTQAQTHIGSQDRLVDMIQENTKISTDAFEEANHAKQLLTEEIAARNDLIKRLQGSQNRRRETDPQITDLQGRVARLEAALWPTPGEQVDP